MNLLRGYQTREQQMLFDCFTKKLVSYDSTNSKLQSSELQRVLVTHMAICCLRCMEGRVCGQENKTPTNPIISNNYELKL